MPRKEPPQIVPLFTWTHFATDGKLENIAEALDGSPIDRICLHILDPSMDEVSEFLSDKQEMLDRLARCKQVVRRFKRDFDIAADLSLPGVLAAKPYNNADKKNLTTLYAHAPQTKTETIWVNDASLFFSDYGYNMVDSDVLQEFARRKHHKVTRNRLGNLLRKDRQGTLTLNEKRILDDLQSFRLNWIRQLARRIEKTVHNDNPSAILGLIAYDKTLQASFSSEISQIFGGRHQPLLVTSSIFSLYEDDDRTSILSTANFLSATRHYQSTIQVGGHSTSLYPSTFSKAAESMQMEIQLQTLNGRNPVILDCFDDAGTAPNNHPYLTMLRDRARLTQKLKQLVPKSSTATGIRIFSEDEYSPSCWAHTLLRMGIPVHIDTPETFNPDSPPCASILPENVVDKMNGKQLKAVFEQGVLLEASTAITLKEMGYGDWLGTTISKPMSDAVYEILSDQAFAAPFYGHRTPMLDYDDDEIRSLTPDTESVKVITTFLRDGDIPNTPGMVFHENASKGYYCAILPYSLTESRTGSILTIQRQRHFHDVLVSLGRRRLPCYVENSPDLVPFYFADPKGRRVILALLNVSFDWAINTRIRLGQLPDRIKNVRELDDHGKLLSYPDLEITRAGEYHYIELSPDTAVPPMQMGIFVLE